MLKFILRSKACLKINQREKLNSCAKAFSTDNSDKSNKKEVFILRPRDKKPEVKPVQTPTTSQQKSEKFITLKSNLPKDDRRDQRQIKPKDETNVLAWKKEKFLDGEIEADEVLIEEKKIYPSYMTQNRSYFKYIKSLEKMTKNYFDKIYNNTITALIKKKISQLEKDLNEIKNENSNEIDKKVQSVKVESNSVESSKSEDNPLKSKPNTQDHAALFSSSSIKDFESKLAKLPILVLNDFNFKTKILGFYLERNVDKAFEFFYDNMRHDSIETSNAENLSEFVKALLKYDKVEYLKAIFEIFARNEVNTSKLSDPIFNFTVSFSDYMNFHTKVSFDYNAAIVGLKFIFHHLGKSQTVNTSARFNETISETFNKLAEIQFKSRKISENDDILQIIREYRSILNSDMEFKAKQNSLYLNEEALAKILSLTFDNSNNVNELDLLQIILDISNKQENLLKYLTENVTAYYQLFGFSPKILSGKRLKTKYHELRAKLQNKDSNSSIITANQLEFFYNLLKLNSLCDYAGDCLRNWNEFLGTANSKKQSSVKVYERCLADFILSSDIEADHYYNKNIDKVFKEKSKSINSTNNVDYLVAKTLAFLKDGNIDFAVEDFLKNIDSNIKNAKDSDKELVNFYNQMFIERESVVKKEDADGDIEFEFSLRKANLLEKLRENVIQLFSYLNETQLDNKFRTKESFIDLFKVYKGVDEKNKGELFLKNKLLARIKKDLNSLGSLTIEGVKSDLHEKNLQANLSDKEKLENIYAKIKVDLYQDDYKYQLLSNILNRNIIHVSDIFNLELNEKEKKSLLDNIQRSMFSISDKNYSKFAKLVYEFFSLKPVSFKRVEYISEEDIYKTEGKKVVTPVLTPGRIKTEFLNEVLKTVPSLEDIIPNYKTLLSNNNHNSNGESSLVITPETQSSFRSFVMANSMMNLDNYNKLYNFNKINKNISRICDRVSYYKLITLNHIKDNRQRNIIKALYTRESRNSKTSQLASTAVYISHKIHNRNLQKFSAEEKNLFLLKTLTEISSNMVSRRDNSYIESIVDELLKIKNIQSNISDKAIDSNRNKLMTTTGKVEKMKELFNQEYEVFTAKHAVYMILYGIEHNLPFAIRLAEKVCDDLGYVLPSWVELRLNKYLLSHSKEYAATVSRISPVNVANVYRGDSEKDKISDDRGVGSVNANNNGGSIYAVDYLPFKGLEQIVDLKKFTMLIKNIEVKF